METLGGGNNSWGEEVDFPRCLYSNESPSMERIVDRSRKAKTGLSSSRSGYPIAEDIVAILSAIPSGILIYISIYYSSFLSSQGPITFVLAIAFGSTVALIRAL